MENIVRLPSALANSLTELRYTRFRQTKATVQNGSTLLKPAGKILDPSIIHPASTRQFVNFILTKTATLQVCG